ncbi:MAG: class II aldolase/adducin family protein [Candidatus Cloacimonetes bacterium]|nr:class II aldolase/adducin family protein [Candidatus Cloacimonadota bacterium]
MTKRIDLPDQLLPELIDKSSEFRELLYRISRVAEAIFHHGWAEANAGNLSIDISKIVIRYFPASPSSTRYYLVSRSGSRFRDLKHSPDDGLMIVELSPRQRFYPQDAIPTSEWPCHKAMHEADTDWQYPCLLHSHSTEIIALCNTPLINNPYKLNAVLAKLLPELGIYLPKGIAVSEPAPPGSLQLAKCSVSSIDDRQILIWPGHGLLCRARDIDTALDLMEIANKAARIYFMTCKQR